LLELHHQHLSQLHHVPCKVWSQTSSPAKVLCLFVRAAQQDNQIKQPHVPKEDLQVQRHILTSTVTAQAKKIRILGVQLATLHFLMDSY
jgi:hypothetical protein